MRRAGIHLQHLLHMLPRQRRLREHPPHGPLDHALGMLREQGLERGEPLVPHVPGVPEVALLLELAPGELHLCGVDDHHEIPGVQVRGERRLVLAPQHLRDATREPAERLPVGPARGAASGGRWRLRSSSASTSTRSPTTPNAQRPGPSPGWTATVQESPASSRWYSGVPGSGASCASNPSPPTVTRVPSTSTSTVRSPMRTEYFTEPPPTPIADFGLRLAD